jgi:glycosyltransferase involved in cell wall biosynthesis
MRVSKPLVSLFLPTLLIGGAEKALVLLANKLSAEGWHIHLVVMSAKGPMTEYLSAAVELIDLRCISIRQAIIALARYYNAYRPDVILTSLYSTGLSAIAARFIVSYKPKVLVGAHNSLSAKFSFPDNAKDKWLLKPLCRFLFPLADGFIPVSKGLGNELKELLCIPGKPIYTIYNPVVNDSITELAAEPVNHPWLVAPTLRQHKTLVSVGRLVEQKGYDTLLMSLKLIRNSQDCRLIIVGGGPLLTDLESLARHLGLSDAVDFVGWQTNPYKYVACADLFVLSSRWEGLANVLIEALACGCPVVSTNCNYGPVEILDGGKYGALARVDDPYDLAEKIVSSLSFSHVPDKVDLVKRSLDFSVEVSAGEYARFFTKILSGSSDLKQVTS